MLLAGGVAVAERVLVAGHGGVVGVAVAGGVVIAGGVVVAAAHDTFSTLATIAAEKRGGGSGSVHGLLFCDRS